MYLNISKMYLNVSNGLKNRIKLNAKNNSNPMKLFKDNVW